MKYLFIFFAVIIIAFANCKKDNTVSIEGSWNLINDSANSRIGAFDSSYNYKGMNSDYFNFNNDGKLYIKEDTLYDTLNYQILNNNRIIIDSISILENGEYLPSNIIALTAQRASIEVTNNVQNPGGTYTRLINLSRN